MPSLLPAWMSCPTHGSSCGGSNLKADSQETGHGKRNRDVVSVGFSSGQRMGVGCLGRWPQMSKAVEVEIRITSKEGPKSKVRTP